jgi:hypothetical protein
VLDAGLAAIEDLERLLGVALGARVDLLARERRPRLALAARITDRRREVADWRIFAISTA